MLACIGNWTISRKYTCLSSGIFWLRNVLLLYRGEMMFTFRHWVLVCFQCICGFRRCNSCWFIYFRYDRKNFNFYQIKFARWLIRLWKSLCRMDNLKKNQYLKSMHVNADIISHCYNRCWQKRDNVLYGTYH